MSDVERGWFRLHAAREDVAYTYSTDAEPEADFLKVETADASADLAHFAAECHVAAKPRRICPSMKWSRVTDIIPSGRVISDGSTCT